MRARPIRGAAAEDEALGISLSALVAALTGATVLAVHLWILLGREGDSWHDAAPFASMLGLGVLCAAVAAFAPSERLRLAAAAPAVAVFFTGAVLGALSIGVFLLPAAVASLLCLSSAGAHVSLRATWLAAGAAGAGALLLVVLWLF